MNIGYTLYFILIVATLVKTISLGIETATAMEQEDWADYHHKDRKLAVAVFLLYFELLAGVVLLVNAGD